VHDVYWTSFYPPCRTRSECRRNAGSISVLCSYGAYLFYGRTDRHTDCSFPKMVKWNFTIYTRISFRSCNPQLRRVLVNDAASCSDWQETIVICSSKSARKAIIIKTNISLPILSTLLILNGFSDFKDLFPNTKISSEYKAERYQSKNRFDANGQLLYLSKILKCNLCTKFVCKALKNKIHLCYRLDTRKITEDLTVAKWLTSGFAKWLTSSLRTFTTRPREQYEYPATRSQVHWGWWRHLWKVVMRCARRRRAWVLSIADHQ
jgi:hypothetical protein